MEPARKAVWGWALYDWANSAFATTVMAGFFPLFFRQYWSQGLDPNLTTARLGLANSAAGLLVALMAPLLGALADRRGGHKGFLGFFTYLGVLATAALFWVGPGGWAWAAALYALAVVGFSGANLFYDSLLPHVAPRGALDRVSGLGYGLGYLGGGILFTLNLLMVTWPRAWGLADAGQAVRFSFLSVALWWGGFACLTWAWVPAPVAPPDAPGGWRAVTEGLARLRQTLGRARRHRQVWLFLLAYWCYIDGVDTIIRMALDFGMVLGLEQGQLIAALLMVQFIGFPAAIVFGRLGQRWGTRRSLLLGVAAYLAITLYATRITHTWEFFLLAGGIAVFQGGVQALSRSLYARLIPPGREAEFFGFYNLLGKFAVILGPLLMGGMGLLARRFLVTPGPGAGEAAARWGVAAVAVLFVAGGLLLWRVREPAPGDGDRKAGIG